MLLKYNRIPAPNPRKLVPPATSFGELFERLAKVSLWREELEGF
jgi:hypothetical protein